MIYENNWTDFALLDTADKNRLERWGKYILIRPDPQAIWSPDKANRHELWGKADAIYHRSSDGGGSWKYNRKLPNMWKIEYAPLGLKFEISPMGFKHTGLFPEQAANWRFMYDIIKGAKSVAPDKEINVLNLFAYTGGATVACAAAGASVCHVDAQKGIVDMARRNAAHSGLADAKIRYITDDCSKFTAREERRGKKYDAIIMDPPSFGRGASGELWKIEDNLYGFLRQIIRILSDEPLFVLVNLYTAGLAPSCAGYMLHTLLKPIFGGSVHSDEIGLPVLHSSSPFPCGAFSRWCGDAGIR